MTDKPTEKEQWEQRMVAIRTEITELGVEITNKYGEAYLSFAELRYNLYEATQHMGKALVNLLKPKKNLPKERRPDEG